jgi:signal transduction histidine kinase
VLIVDDHAPLAANLRDLLIDLAPGIEITVLGSGALALALAKTHGFDVAVVDVKLPDLSGVDLLPQLRAVAPLGEVVLITGYATLDSALAALRGGAFALLLKSFRPEELRSTVEQALAKVTLRRERDRLERRYRALVDVADVIVLGLDARGVVAMANPKFGVAADVAPSDAIGVDLADRWIAAADRERFRVAVASVAASRAPRELEATIVRRDDAKISSRIRWHLSTDAEDAVALVFAIGVDVTEQRRLERRVANAEAMSTMGTLAAGLAHEIRNPLNAAVLQLHVLARHVEREVADEAARTSMRQRTHVVVGEIKRLARLLGDFLELARPRGLARETIDVDDWIDGVLDLHREEASNRGVELSRSVGVRGLCVEGDREKLRQVLINLIVNALDATPEGGRVEVDALADGTGVRVEVRDTGAGISDDDRAHLFDPFFTTKPGGTGLGLSIVHKIVEQHRGAIDVRSALGLGTQVVVTLPDASTTTTDVA